MLNGDMSDNVKEAFSIAGGSVITECSQGDDNIVSSDQMDIAPKNGLCGISRDIITSRAEMPNSKT